MVVAVVVVWLVVFFSFCSTPIQSFRHTTVDLQIVKEIHINSCKFFLPHAAAFPNPRRRKKLGLRGILGAKSQAPNPDPVSRCLFCSSGGWSDGVMVCVGWPCWIGREKKKPPMEKRMSWQSRVWKNFPHPPLPSLIIRWINWSTCTECLCCAEDVWMYIALPCNYKWNNALR